ncbi:DUF1839 domain-containing protein, partial [Burkholderia pseudomallei]
HASLIDGVARIAPPGRVEPNPPFGTLYVPPRPGTAVR